MNGQMEVKYGKQDMPEYVRDILTAGASRLFLPAGFVEEDELLFGHFRTEGYRNLSAVRKLETENILAVILAILHGIWQTERIYLFSEMYQIRADCIYVDRQYTDVRMVYVPAGWAKKSEMPEETLTEKLEKLLETMRGSGSRQSGPYIDKVISFLQENWGYKALVHRLEELRREVYLCGVK